MKELWAIENSRKKTEKKLLDLKIISLPNNNSVVTYLLGLN